jgi:nucleoside-diphosphate-sugar epimerase
LEGQEVISLDLKTDFDLRKHSLKPYSNFDFIWFLAWDVGGSNYLVNPDYQQDILLNNVIICERVFDFLYRSKIRFLFTTSQLSGSDNAYGITKMLGEYWTYQIGGKLARLWNVYGWEPPGIRSHVIPDLVMMGLKEKAIYLQTSGQERRQFIFDSDCVDALIQLRETPGCNYADITKPPWFTIKQVADEIGRQINVPVFRGKTIGYNKIVEPEKPLKGWTPKIDLQQGISRVILKAKEFTQQS